MGFFSAIWATWAREHMVMDVYVNIDVHRTWERLKTAGCM